MMRKKIIKWILFIILVVIILAMANIIRNYVILNKLRDKLHELEKLDKFSYSYTIDNNKVIITQIDGILKVEKPRENWIMYFNNNEEGGAIKEDTLTGEKTYYSNTFSSSASLILIDLEYSFQEALLNNVIITKKINDEKCYKIKFPSLDATYYVSTETGLTLAAINNDKEIGNTGKMVYYNYEFENIDKIDFETLKKLSSKGDMLSLNDDEINVSQFNSQFTIFKGLKEGGEVTKLLEKVAENASSNYNDDRKLPDIIYLDEDDSVFNSNISQISVLHDDDIVTILKAEAIDDSFNLKYNKDVSFKIVSNTSNSVNSESMIDLSNNINALDNYYIKFVNNLETGLIENIIIYHLK